MFNKNSLIRFFVLASILSLTVFAVSRVITVYADNDNDNDNDSSIEDLIEGKGQFKFDVFPQGIEKNFEIRQPSLNVNPQGKTLIIAGEVTEANWPN